MLSYKDQFIRLAIQYQALKFGEFTLKSGRISPYFFNAGVFNSGHSLAELGRIYSQAYVEQGLECDVLFGPAYKGIPLVSSMAVALATYQNIDKPYAFNRKEAKDHGEGGTIVGASIKGNVLIIDDVITAGTAIREAADIITGQGGNAKGVLIALDRQEKGKGSLSAIQEVQQDYGILVHSLVSLNDLIDYLDGDAELGTHVAALKTYREQYGV